MRPHQFIAHRSGLLLPCAARAARRYCVSVLVAALGLGAGANLSAKVLVVTNTNDSGPGSLRQQVQDAAGNDEIQFAPNLSGYTVTLTSGEINLKPANLTITGPGAELLRVSGNHASRIFNIPAGTYAFVQITGLTLIDGFAGANLANFSGVGGAINSAAPGLLISGCAFRGNSPQSGDPRLGGSEGGAIFNSGKAEIRKSEFSNNSAQGGGAISNTGSLFVSNSTFSKNIVSFGGQGGGGAILNDGGLQLFDSTVADNTADGFGGGVYNKFTNGAWRDAQIRSVIIAGNHAGSSPDVYGAYNSFGFNLIGSSDAGNGFGPPNGPATDQHGPDGSGQPLDPRLSPLAYNGGTTRTMELLPDSRAIDQGFAMGATDQRGLPRRFDFAEVANAVPTDGSDIGAYELQGGNLINISTRARVGTGENALIGGFILSGILSGNETKTVMIRAIGPSLERAGVKEALQDPNLELYNSSGLLASNNNWKDTKQTEIQATGLAPADDREAALLEGLPITSAYTAIVRGAGQSSGIALVEVYDLRQRRYSLGNISTRAFVGTGDNVMIGGFIVGPGTGAGAKIVMRGLGPSLQRLACKTPWTIRPSNCTTATVRPSS